MGRGELRKYSAPTDLPARRSDSNVPVVPLIVFGTVAIVGLAVVAIAAAVVAMSIALAAISLRSYWKK